MLPLNLVFLSVLCLTVLSGSAAVWLVMLQGSNPSRKKVAERLMQIALLGAATIFVLLESVSDL